MVKLKDKVQIVTKEDPNIVYPEDYLIVEDVTVVKSALDTMLASMKEPSKVVVASVQAAIMAISMPQAVVLMKVFQSIGYYIYLDCLHPQNFARLLEMISESPFDLMPNIFKNMFIDDGYVDQERFGLYEWTVNPF